VSAVVGNESGNLGSCVYVCDCDCGFGCVVRDGEMRMISRG